MKKVNVPRNKIARFAGKWIVIDPVEDTIIAVGETMRDIAPLVTHSVGDEVAPAGKAPFSFLVPRKDEGPYVLWIIF
ncbi:MAG: Uncharacterized protein G01um101416_832 [Microgenomates group bacterium Gr01-1014_16]|nr:MAG: Uncharacterized protein G01um101416_832 [Microgenomates group bacterium Gr01-1014_16]